MERSTLTDQPRLVVISNRVAVPKARGAAGAQGGLAGALLAALSDRKGLWFGWSGQESESGRTGHIDTQTNDGVTTATIDLSQRDIDEYYNGYANSTLWPLFHYRLDLASPYAHTVLRQLSTISFHHVQQRRGENCFDLSQHGNYECFRNEVLPSL